MIDLPVCARRRIMHFLEQWFVTAVKSSGSKERGPLRIWGVPRSNLANQNGFLWRSSSVVSRLSSTELLTRHGSKVRLFGPIDKTAATRVSMNSDAMNAFTNGFPNEWREIAENAFQTELTRRNVTYQAHKKVGESTENRIVCDDKSTTSKRTENGTLKRARSIPTPHVKITAEPRRAFEPLSKRRRVVNQIRKSCAKASSENDCDNVNKQIAFEDSELNDRKAVENNQTAPTTSARHKQMSPPVAVPIFIKSSQSTVGDDDVGFIVSSEFVEADPPSMDSEHRKPAASSVALEKEDRKNDNSPNDVPPQPLIDDDVVTEKDESVDSDVIPPSALAALDFIMQANSPGLLFSDSSDV